MGFGGRAEGGDGVVWASGVAGNEDVGGIGGHGTVQGYVQCITRLLVQRPLQRQHLVGDRQAGIVGMSSTQAATAEKPRTLSP